ncbi:MAG: hypothetical protein IJ689_02720 [Alphaproteobacteria bacterium]|nr:hypothetical protein [Alphaproteobacteria bacterium]
MVKIDLNDLIKTDKDKRLRDLLFEISEEYYEKADEEPRMVEVVVLEKTDKKKYYTFDARKDDEKQNSLPLVNTAAGSFKAVNSAYDYNIAFIESCQL